MQLCSFRQIRLFGILGLCWLMMSVVIPQSAFAAASISITKFAEVSTAEVGDKVHYDITITNTGTVKLTNIKVSDSLLGGTLSFPKSLEAGKSSCQEFIHTIVAGDVTNCLVKNTASVEAYYNTTKITKSASATVQVPDGTKPAIKITKEANTEISKAGDKITYTIRIKNIGNTTLRNFVLKDANINDGKALTGCPSSLAPGASSNKLTFTYVVKESDPDLLINTVTVTATSGSNSSTKTVTASAKELVCLIHPKIAITKTVDPGKAMIGDIVTYTITVKNIGDVILKNIEVTDPLLDDDPLEGFPSSLKPGECSDPVEFPYCVSDYDVDDDDIVNTVTVHSNPDGLDNDITAEATAVLEVITPKAEIQVTKTADTEVSKVGDTIVFTIIIANTGDFDLTKVTVYDELLGGNITKKFFPYDNSCSLPAGCDPIKKTFKYVVKDGDPNPLVNKVKVTAVAPDCEEKVWDEDSVCIPLVHPAICITKKASVSTAAVGDTIKYTITIKNTGDVDLENITVTDTLLGDITCYFPEELAPGCLETACVEYTVKCSDPSELVNTVTVHANPEDLPNDITSEDSATVTITCGGGSSGGAKLLPDMMIYNNAYSNRIGWHVYSTTGTDQVQSQSTAKGCKITYPIRMENDTNETVTMNITGVIENGNGWKVEFRNAMNGGTDITNQVMGSGWNPAINSITMAPGKARDFIVTVTPTNSSLQCGNSVVVRVTATVKGTSKCDTVRAITTVK